jgi:GT2 family glycosyltransferase
LKVGIVIPFYNGHQWLNRLVQAFDNASHGYECTLFIIDNSPGNLTVEVGLSTGISVEVIREKPGLGYGKACNVGYQRCKERGFEYIIVANQDGYVSQNFIREILNPFHQDDRVLMTAPLLRMYGSEAIEDFFIKFYLSQVPELISDLIDGTGRSYYEMKRISGACFAFRLKTNLYRYPYFFDPLFHMYYEDEDLCQRVHQAGGKIVLICPSAVYYHQHSHTTDLDNIQSIESDKLVSEKILRLKNGSKSSAKALYGIFVTTISGITYHIFRAELYKAYAHLRSLVVILYKLPAILKTKREDFLNSRAINK